jgi:hypothetical protein
MGSNSADIPARATAEQILSAELARSHRAADSVIPVLRHLLASEGPPLVNEAVVARVRGMLHDLACQLYLGRRGPVRESISAQQAVNVIIERLVSHDTLLAMIHNLALESQLAERFEQQLSLDPVLSPLMQELIASDDPVVAELAMNTLTAQARFMQSQRRMEMPLEELPAELLSAAVASADGIGHPDSERSLESLRREYDEAATRLSLLERLVAAMRRASVACLSFDRAGLALFASGLAAHAGEERAQAIISCNEQQTLRLALALRAAGLDMESIERQVLLIGAASPAYRAIGDLTAQQAQTQLRTTSQRKQA